MKTRVYHLDSVPWRPVRPALTRGVEGKDLIPEGVRAEKAVLTRVAPDGEFLPHCDSYHHVLLVLQGEGEAFSGEETAPLRPGTVIEIAAGERHGYRNTGREDLLLWTLNLTDC